MQSKPRNPGAARAERICDALMVERRTPLEVARAAPTSR
jgi:hypothetical protein